MPQPPNFMQRNGWSEEAKWKTNGHLYIPILFSIIQFTSFMEGKCLKNKNQKEMQAKTSFFSLFFFFFQFAQHSGKPPGL